MRILKKKKGFTLIELLVVLAIIAILTAIIYASFSTAQAQGRDKKRIADLSLLQVALEGYFNQYGQYPTSTLSVLVPNYIGAIPTPPSGGPNGSTYYYDNMNAADYTYNYKYNYQPLSSESNPTVCTSYQLWTTLETNSPYLASKAGLDSINGLDNQFDAALPSGMELCIVSGSNTSTQVDATNIPLVYDIVPR